MNTHRYVSAAGRILLALIFVLSGFSKIAGWHQTAGYMASQGVPMVPFLLTATILIEVFAGLALLTGLRVRYAAPVLAGWLIIVSFVMHPFWAAPPDQAQMQMINFMKNLSIFGGLLFVAAQGAGAFSLDAWLESRRARHSSTPPRVTPARA